MIKFKNPKHLMRIARPTMKERFEEIFFWIWAIPVALILLPFFLLFWAWIKGYAKYTDNKNKNENHHRASRKE